MANLGRVSANSTTATLRQLLRCYSPRIAMRRWSEWRAWFAPHFRECRTILVRCERLRCDFVACLACQLLLWMLKRWILPNLSDMLLSVVRPLHWLAHAHAPRLRNDCASLCTCKRVETKLPAIATCTRKKLPHLMNFISNSKPVLLDSPS